MPYLLWRFLCLLCFYVLNILFRGCCGVLPLLAPSCSVSSLLPEHLILRARCACPWLEAGGMRDGAKKHNCCACRQGTRPCCRGASEVNDLRHGFQDRETQDLTCKILARSSCGQDFMRAFHIELYSEKLKSSKAFTSFEDLKALMRICDPGGS